MSRYDVFVSEGVAPDAAMRRNLEALDYGE
jgi:hypothetical protein